MHSSPAYRTFIQRNMMKRFVSILLTMTVASAGISSSRDDDDDFNSFMRSSLKEFNEFISQANKDFINFMREPWKKYDSEKPIEKRTKPEPTLQPKYEPTNELEGGVVRHELTIQEILDLSSAEGKQKAVSTFDSGLEKEIQFDTPKVKVDKTEKKNEEKEISISENVKDVPKTTPTDHSKSKVVSDPAVSVKPNNALYSGDEGRHKITYAGVDYYLPDGLKRAISLSSLDENGVADAYEALFRSDYKPLVNDLKKVYNDDLKNEWALFMLIRKVAEVFCGKSESVVMRQFLLNQLGFKARVARVDDSRLTLFVAPDTKLYGVIYTTIGGVTFYDTDARQPYTFYMCSKDSPSAKKTVSMKVKVAPRTGSATRTLVRSIKDASVKTTIPVGLMEFYNDIPQCEYDVYATAAVAPQIKKDILSSLKGSVAGKDEKTAASILLDFCQNAFEYATDKQQFGYEKPFFVEELFYYPQCDCEDRSILYRYLVKELLNLDVVLLNYPGHVATAVKFNDQNIQGDYVMVNGSKFLVCDPTFIGASIGMAMPEYKKTGAKILRY